MKRIGVGLAVAICLLVASNASASMIAIKTGPTYGVESSGTDMGRTARPLAAVQQMTLASASEGAYSPSGSDISAISGDKGDRPPVDTLAIPAPTPNPEPASLLLLGTGIAGLVIRRRKRA